MVLGLTGFSGAGKSTVAALLIRQGFYHIDCDQVVHNEVYQDPKVLDAIAAAFGAETVQEGVLDRRLLRNRTMGNPAAISRLNQVVMPSVMAAIERHLNTHQGEKVILDAPLLFEYGLEKRCDYTLSVIAEETLALERIVQRDSISEEDAKKRLSSQKTAAYYIDKSDYVITNNKDSAALEMQVQELLKKII